MLNLHDMDTGLTENNGHTTSSSTFSPTVVANRNIKYNRSVFENVKPHVKSATIINTSKSVFSVSATDKFVILKVEELTGNEMVNL